MPEFTEKQRTGCAFGAFYTALAIENVLPIAHSGPGCVNQARNALAFKNGGQGPSKYSEALIPCTNFTEKDVVFGAVEKLKTTIAHTIENFDADMLVVLSGCTSEIVADDIESVVDSFRDAPMPIIGVEVAGFKGNNLYGHEQIIKAIINGYVKPTGTINPKQVNVWGIVPYFDPFWDGTYRAVEQLLIKVGLEPNIIYGGGRGLKNVQKIPSAAFNLVLSPWSDVEIVKLLEQKFSTPYFHYPNLPVGPQDTTRFLRALAEYASLDQQRVEEVIREGEETYFYYFERAMHWVFDGNMAPKRFVIIANSNTALSLSKHLVGELGLVPDSIYITDGVPEAYQAGILQQIQSFEPQLNPEVVFTQDGGRPQVEISAKLKEHPLWQPPYVLGTFWDDPWAKQQGSPFLSVSMPLGERIVLNKTYFGYRGGLTFFEDFYSAFCI